MSPLPFLRFKKLERLRAIFCRNTGVVLARAAKCLLVLVAHLIERQLYESISPPRIVPVFVSASCSGVGAHLILDFIHEIFSFSASKRQLVLLLQLLLNCVQLLV